jgi:hypothetical protein
MLRFAAVGQPLDRLIEPSLSSFVSFPRLHKHHSDDAAMRTELCACLPRW